VTSRIARALFTAALALVLAVPAARAADAVLPKGAWSVGAQGGLSFFSMGDVNDILIIQNQLQGTRWEELHQGWEATGDVRYAVEPKFFLGLEAGVIRGTAHDQNSSDELRASGTAVVAQGGATVDASGPVAVRVLAGLGGLFGAGIEVPGSFHIDDSAFLGYAGLEVEVRVMEKLGLTAQGLARTCRMSQPDGAPYDIDFTGGTVRAGLRTTFGGIP
jgi:hypothetical protein